MTTFYAHLTAAAIIAGLAMLLLVTYALCRVSGEADERAERMEAASREESPT